MRAGVAWLAWREILAEVLGDLPVQVNVSPEWLVNPHTGRRLTLDLYYPDVHFAVQFTGVQPAGRRRRVSDQERAAEAEREAVRQAVCAAHGVALVVIQVMASEPRRELDRLYMGLGSAMRHVAHAADLSHAEKSRRLDLLAAARRRLSDIRDRVRRPEDLAIFAEKWRDREARAQRAARRAAQTPRAGHSVVFREGMRVRHERFGVGVVQAVLPEGNGDQRIVVEFPEAGRRTFLASLVGDKLRPA